jgi:hypothetical protein
MSRTPKTQTARRIVSAIQQNVARLYDGLIDYPDFDRRQRDLWDEARRAGIGGEVARLVAPPLASRTRAMRAK